MILDGYNRMALVGDIRVVYRPFLIAHVNERRRLRFELKFLGGDRQREGWDSFLWSHIVDWTYGYSGPDAIDRLRLEKPSGFEKLRLLLHGVEPDLSGHRWRDIELEWRQNLYDGVRLDLIDPKLSKRSCEDCQKYWYLANGMVKTIASTGEREFRPEEAYPSCKTEFGCLKGTPDKQKSLNTANGWAWRHFKQCEAIGRFPDDPIVSHNADVIRRAIKSVK
jgi:hypothetical protein